MNKLPHVLGIVPCDRIAFDPRTGLYSLIDVFVRFTWIGRWPLLKPFMVFGTLFNGKGEGAMRLILTHLETERLIYRFTRWYTSPDQGQSHYLEIPVTKCQFPVPGRYRLSLRIDDEEIACQYLDILRG